MRTLVFFSYISNYIYKLKTLGLVSTLAGEFHFAPTKQGMVTRAKYLIFDKKELNFEKSRKFCQFRKLPLPKIHTFI